MVIPQKKVAFLTFFPSFLDQPTLINEIMGQASDCNKDGIFFLLIVKICILKNEFNNNNHA
jgi:hypothetical protein